MVKNGISKRLKMFVSEGNVLDIIHIKKLQKFEPGKTYWDGDSDSWYKVLAAGKNPHCDSLYIEDVTILNEQGDVLHITTFLNERWDYEVILLKGYLAKIEAGSEAYAEYRNIKNGYAC